MAKVDFVLKIKDEPCILKVAILQVAAMKT